MSELCEEGKRLPPDVGGGVPEARPVQGVPEADEGVRLDSRPG
ncbi:hypothetical protein AB0J71_23715 [Nonomuraea sp. NPDC049637]